MNKIKKILGIDEVYTIGYRYVQNAIDKFIKVEDLKAFTFFKVSNRYWFADPILFEKCLFMEMYDRTKDKGFIACSIYNESKKQFSTPQKIIEEKFHMSFPEVFVFENKKYMIPETGNTKNIYIYECITFPYEWKINTIIPVKDVLTDSIIIENNEKKYIITSILNHQNSFTTTRKIYELLYNKIEEKFEIKEIFASSNREKPSYDERNAGNIVEINKSRFRPVQICTDSKYGIGIGFKRQINIDNEVLSELHTEYCLLASDCKKINGIHTYSLSDDKHIEIVDVRFKKWRPLFIFHILKNKIKKVSGYFSEK